MREMVEDLPSITDEIPRHIWVLTPPRILETWHLHFKQIKKNIGRNWRWVSGIFPVYTTQYPMLVQFKP